MQGEKLKITFFPLKKYVVPLAKCTGSFWIACIVSVISDKINECISLPHPFCSEQRPKKYNDIGIQLSTWKIRKKDEKKVS